MAWKTLEHNGILIPPPYESKGVRVKVRGQPVQLDLVQEEMAYQWAKKKDTPYSQDKVFQRNFTADFVRALGPKFKGVSYGDIDFGQAYKLVDREKAAKEAMTKEERKELSKKRKELREELKAKYGVVIMDGKPVEIGNYMAEPPGIFIGRGEHPLRGRWKPRITEKDITLNLGKKAKVPKGDWGKIVHEKDVMWIATWTDYLTKKSKYVWLADTAGPKQEKDKAKYEKAVTLKKDIGKVRERIVSDMGGKDPRKKTVATVCYLIYKTSMRVGDEKDPDEADTVGATTLRKEHVKITHGAIELDFLGKDSIRWQETIKVQGDDVQFQENLKELISTIKPKDEIFGKIRSSDVNKYYSNIVKGMTAKVFRTYLATKVVREYLARHEDMAEKSPNERLYHAKMANLEAAKMCNHKRTIPKTFKQSLQKKKDSLKKVEALTPWAKAEENLKKARASKPKTAKQKKGRRERIKKLKEQAAKSRARHAERVERMRLQLDLAKKTKDYNLGTSLRNYIDPRPVKAWTDEVGVEWEKLYTAALQKKFLWVRAEKGRWKDLRA